MDRQEHFADDLRGSSDFTLSLSPPGAAEMVVGILGSKWLVCMHAHGRSGGQALLGELHDEKGVFVVSYLEG